MKILHILWELRYGGAETMLVDIANLQALNNEVEILIINSDIAQSLLATLNKNIKVRRINRPAQSRNPFYIIEMNMVIASSDADIFHFHQDNLIKYIPVRILKKNLCLTVHGVKLDIKCVRKYDYVFAISEAVKESVKRKTGIDAMLVENGVDIKRFHKQKNKQNTIFRIVQVGRLTHECKGQHLSLSAVHQLVNQYNCRNLHLDIIGWGISENYLKDMATQLSITDYVSFLGLCDKKYIREHLADYDLLIQPSLWEGFGLTIVEAISALTPVLLSNVDGMKTISQNGQYTYIFKSNDVEDYAEQLHKIICLPAEKREDMAEKAYEYALKHFDISVTVDRYLSYYKEILHRENPDT
jgi:glycosyltransferase involved in cell wall biosynthesis